MKYIKNTTEFYIEEFAGIYEFKKETRDYKPLKVFMEL